MRHFEDNYIPDPMSGCWLWVGTMSSGYGRFMAAGKNIYAHRHSYFLKHGKYPSRFACHTCDTKACVNPAHLYDGSAADNNRDSWERGGRTPPRRAFCKRGHARTPENLTASSACRICKQMTPEQRRRP